LSRRAPVALAEDGPAAPPRKNGELQFQAEWEGRAFGLAVALNERHVYHWDDFRAQLVASIAAAEASGDEGGYYEQWLAALESLLVARGLVTRGELDARTAGLVAAQEQELHGHDHHHG
jgi:nitrile hydratase accessory protein